MIWLHLWKYVLIYIVSDGNGSSTFDHVCDQDGGGKQIIIFNYLATRIGEELHSSQATLDSVSP